MLRSPIRFAFPGSLVLGFVALFALTAGLVWAATPPTVSFETTIGPPPATASFDIGFVKNDIGKYVLADRTNNAVDLFDATVPDFTGYIGQNGFVGNHPTCGKPHACSGPNGVAIDDNNHVWAGDGPASACSTPGAMPCACTTGETTSMVKEYLLATGTGASGRLACLDTGGHYRADEMGFDPRDEELLVANDADGFLTLIKTEEPASIAAKFCYTGNDVGCTANTTLTTPNGIEQPVYDPKTHLFYLAIPGSSTADSGRIDVFNPAGGNLVYVKSLSTAPSGCTGGPTGLALDKTSELLGACSNGAVLVDIGGKSPTLIGNATTTGGADEIWFDSISDAWYLSTPGQLGVVSAEKGNAIQDPTSTGCCGHSVAAYGAKREGDDTGVTTIFDPNSGGTGISVFQSIKKSR